MKCGIDPGRYKIGLALVEGDDLLFSAIIPKCEEQTIVAVLRNASWSDIFKWCREGSLEKISGRDIDKICIGNGTSSSEIQTLLAGFDIEIINEYGTTLEGRKLYWRLHPPKGLWRLMPISLRIPPRDVDDLAAWAIIRESV